VAVIPLMTLGIQQAPLCIILAAQMMYGLQPALFVQNKTFVAVSGAYVEHFIVDP
jgi:TctA family transporter